MSARLPWAMLGLSVSLASLASAQPRPGAPADDLPPDLMARYEYRARMLRVMEISEALEMSPPESVKLSDTLAQFDEKRTPLQHELQANAKILRRAARGHAEAFPKVERALVRVQELRQQLRQLDNELFANLSKGLSPQKKARLALTLARLPGEMRDVAREAREEVNEPGPWRRRPKDPRDEGYDPQPRDDRRRSAPGDDE